MFPFFKQFTSSPLPPTLTKINVNFASANGGDSRTLTGTNLAGGTVMVDSNIATVTFSSPTSITFTVPASSISVFDGNGSVSIVTVTTAGGTVSTNGATANSLWYLPAYYGVSNTGVWTAQNVTTSGSSVATVPDQSGNGFTLTPITGVGTAATYTSSGALSYWTTSSSGGAGFLNSLLSNTSGNVEWVFDGTITSAATNGLLAGLANTAGGLALFPVSISTSSITQYNGGGGATFSNTVTPSLNTEFYLCSSFDGASSQQVLNGGTPVSGQNPGTTLTPGTGVYINGSGSSSSDTWDGITHFIASYASPLSTTGRANYSAYFQNKATLTGIDIDFASANGGESRTITGTNLSGATVMVDSTSATITSSSSTSITFTVPPSSVSTTDGNSSASTVTVTATKGTVSTSGLPGNKLWYVPAYFGTANCAMYSAQNVTTSGGNIATVVDLTGNGNTLTPFTTTAFTNAGPLSFWSNGTLFNASFPSNHIGEWVVAGEMTGTNSGGLTALFGLASTSSTVALCVQQATGGTVLMQFNPSFPSNQVDPGLSATFNLLSYFNGGSSQQILNGGSVITGDNPGSDFGDGGIFTGGAPVGGARVNPANIYAIGFYPSALSITARANWAAYFAAEGLG